MLTKAIIFDMDGVLVDSEGFYLDLFSELIRSHGGEVDQNILYTIPGASADRTWEIIATMWPEPAEPARLRALFHETYPDYCPPYGEILYPEVPQVLHDLKNAGYQLALASSTAMNFIEIMLDETGLRPMFASVLSGRMFKESKPHLQIYLQSAAALGVEPSTCVAVEDSPYGILAGKNAGMTVIARRDERFAFDQSRADAQINDLSELPSLLDKSSSCKANRR